MIFLTGANGLIGSFIARQLLSEGYAIRALKRKHADLSLLNDIKNKIEWIEGDICDISLLNDSLKNIECIIHSAAIVSFSPGREEEMLRINTGGTANLVNAALNNKIPRFCHISSVAALGRKKDATVIDEGSLWENSRLNSNYARSKYLAELEVWRGIEEGLNAVIVNPSIVLGPGNWNGGSTRLFKYAFGNHWFYPPGEMNYIDVRDVAQVVCTLMGHPIHSERFILNAGNISYKKFLEQAALLFKKRPPMLKTSRFLREAGWRLEVVRSWISGEEPVITRETAAISELKVTYDNSKIRKLLTYEFIKPEDSIRWACECLNTNVYK